MQRSGSAVPLGTTTKFDDAVFGPREVANEEIEDFVLLRSPKEGQAHGAPTYQLSAVVATSTCAITHVIRGSDHISNTPKQALLYRALRRRAARLRARASDPRPGPHAALEAPPAPPAWVPTATRDFCRKHSGIFLRCLVGRPARTPIPAHTRNRCAFLAGRREPHQRRVRRAKLEWFNTEYLQNCRSTICFQPCKPNSNAQKSGSQNGPERNANGSRRPWTCCGRARVCCRIFRRGRVRSSAIR